MGQCTAFMHCPLSPATLPQAAPPAWAPVQSPGKQPLASGASAAHSHRADVVASRLVVLHLRHTMDLHEKLVSEPGGSGGRPPHCCCCTHNSASSGFSISVLQRSTTPLKQLSNLHGRHHSTGTCRTASSGTRPPAGGARGLSAAGLSLRQCLTARPALLPPRASAATMRRACLQSVHPPACQSRMPAQCQPPWAHPAAA